MGRFTLRDQVRQLGSLICDLLLTANQGQTIGIGKITRLITEEEEVAAAAPAE